METARHEELGDTIFIEMMDDQGVTRMALPPRVANAIAAQRDSLTSRRRSNAAKARAKADKDAGVLPGFMRTKKHKRMPAKAMAAITAAASTLKE